MSLEPVTGYATLEGRRIAYQIIGDGPVDLLITAGYWGSFDVEWEDPMIRLFYEQLAGLCRVIRFDRLGTGASDSTPLDQLPPWEAFVEEIDVVLDAVDSKTVALFVIADAGAAGLLFAATRPERCRALVLFNSSARYLSADDYPIGPSPEEYIERYGSTVQEDWGTVGQMTAELFFPSKTHDERFLKWLAKLQRNISNPDRALSYSLATMEADGRSLLGSIRVPTLVISRTASPAVAFEHGVYLADHIEGARLVEVPGADAFPFWEHPEVTLRALQDLLGEDKRPTSVNRSVVSVVFTDIVDSTATAEVIGDSRWHALLDLHDAAAGDVLAGYGGRLVKSTGDGVLGTLDGPGRAIRAAVDLRDELKRLGLTIRTGIHTGEVEHRKEDVAGIAVHVAARVMAAAGPDEIWATRTVKDLVTGSGIGFVDRGTHALKGLDGEWELFAIEG